ncbi:hypothetical protein [Kitasatospora sp. NPDC127116]|uniref:hypothetical protein n=1 Tax=Kitasatospora sp. NPDC127116 TaxID=3345367 RepID=UPI00362D742B
MPKDHPKIAEALARQGGPDRIPASRAARQADYLKALIDGNGVVTAAWRSSAVSESTLGRWRTDNRFAVAEQAIREWIAHRPVVPRKAYALRASENQFQRFLELLQDASASIKDAAHEVGLGASTIRYKASRDADFKAQLEALRPVGHGGRRRRPITVVDKA